MRITWADRQDCKMAPLDLLLYLFLEDLVYRHLRTDYDQIGPFDRAIALADPYVDRLSASLMLVRPFVYLEFRLEMLEGLVRPFEKAEYDQSAVERRRV